MSPEEVNLQPRDKEILMHYEHYYGRPSQLRQVKAESTLALKSLYTVGFAPISSSSDWLYLTLGMSGKPMQGVRSPDHRVELLMYSRNEEPELADTLAGLAVYPFENHTHLAPGHTIAGIPDRGVVQGSPLTEILLTPVYFEPEGFDAISMRDGSHIQLLWATPIYYAERMYARQHGWQRLVLDVFTEKEIQTADLWRACAVE